MSVRMLSRPAPPTTSSNKNAAISVSLPASTTSSPPSVQRSSCSGSPPSPSSSNFPAAPDIQRSLSSPPSSNVTGSGGLPSLNLPPSGQQSASSSIGTSSIQAPGSTGINAGSPSSPGTSGVVVVGVIGRVGHEVSQLLDRLLDSHVFGVKNRVWEQWHESDESKLPSSNSIRATTREKKQRKDGHRARDAELHEDGVLERDVSTKEVGGLVSHYSGGKRGSRSEKGHAENGDCRGNEGKIDGVRSAKGHAGMQDLERKKEGQVGGMSGEGGEELCRKTRDGWMEGHRGVSWLLSKLKYHYDGEKGMVYVQFTFGALALDCLQEDSLKVSAAAGGLASTLEHQEADGIRGLLFMFSVCHVILLVQEGARFDPRFLRMFRLLQTAKHSLVPFVKTQLLPGLLPPPSSTSRPSPLKPISLATTNASRTGGIGRNSSTIALMSGSTPVLFPGQCTPVVLFVCLEDITEPTVGLFPQVTTRSEDAVEVSVAAVSPAGSLSHFGNGLSRRTLHLKPVSSGSMVAKTNNKSEPGLRRKLQSSIEAQIRFLLKKCRTVAGSGDGGPLGAGVSPGMGPRGPGGSVNSFQGVGGGGAVFVLDPSRAVIILDRSANWQMDALDAAVDGIEEAVVSGKEGLEDVLWDLGSNGGTSAEDVQAVKDFIWRQAEMLRGKGGISSNTAGGSAGVGMVAAAAAAAAASAASGGSGGTNKPLCNPPELPSFSSWLSACRILAEALSGRRMAEEGEEDSFFKMSDRAQGLVRRVSSTTMSGSGAGSVVRSKGTIDATLLCLESGVDMDLKFSAAWCKRVLGSARDVYLKGLPPCYPTSHHRSQLDKCLRVFHSMVRGPAVPAYAEKLKKECEAVWHSGRQLCDAKSLTGKPCMHQVHEVVDITSTIVARRRVKDDNYDLRKGGRRKHTSKPHSSGVVFLHACSCGRSRRLREDPFDFDSANVSFFKFPNCENMLPSLVIPSPHADLHPGGSPWGMVCLGKSHCYQPGNGLLQSGFCPKQNFLSYWDIPIVYRNAEAHIETRSLSPPKEDLAASGKASLDMEVTTKLLVPPVLETKPVGVNLYSKVAGRGFVDDNRAAPTRAISGSSVMTRMSTDLATKAKYGGESAFPPLPRKQDKPVKQSIGKERRDSLLSFREHQDASAKVLLNDYAEKINDGLGTSIDVNRVHVPNVKGLASLGSNSGLDSMTEHVRVYIGFEYECPHGHRFLLSQDQSGTVSSSDSSLMAGVGKQENGNAVRHSKQKKQDQNELNDSVTRAQELHPAFQDTLGKLTGHSHIFPSKWSQKEIKTADDMHYWNVQEGHGAGHSLLNANLHIYMLCPYCKTLEEEKKPSKGVVFGGNISQLQRIFLVTPPLPVLLASCPMVEFEDISKPVKTMIKFSPGIEIVLPPDSFLSLRLPFVYYSLQDGVPHKPLQVDQNQPEHCAWLLKNTALYVLSKGGRNSPPGG